MSIYMSEMDNECQHKWYQMPGNTGTHMCVLPSGHQGEHQCFCGAFEKESA